MTRLGVNKLNISYLIEPVLQLLLIIFLN